MSTDLAQLPLHTLAAKLKSRSVSPVDIVATCLERIAQAGCRSCTPSWRFTSRRPASPRRRPTKPSARVTPSGRCTAFRSRSRISSSSKAAWRLAARAVWRDRRATRTATLAQKLISAGMIVIGKTHTVEFAFGGWGTNQHLGTPWNPWDAKTHHTPGGSSSGSGVAVAARMVPCALGTDTGGSVRVPAAWCGITGLKTTIGRISTYGVLPLEPDARHAWPHDAQCRGRRPAAAGDARRRSARSAHAGAARCRPDAHATPRREGPAPRTHGRGRAGWRCRRCARRLRPLGRAARGPWAPTSSI